MSTTPPPPITPLRCPINGCLWAAFGIPDQYDGARADYVARHLADEHAEPADATPPPLTDQQLAAIRDSVPIGYDSPWSFELDEDDKHWVVLYATDSPSAGLVATVPDYGMYLAEFIAEARTAVPALLAEVDRLRTQLADRTQLLVDESAERERAQAEREQARAERDRARAELATARADAFREAARVLEHTGRDDDAVNLLDNVAHGITTHAAAGES